MFCEVGIVPSSCMRVRSTDWGQPQFFIGLRGSGLVAPVCRSPTSDAELHALVYRDAHGSRESQHVTRRRLMWAAFRSSTLNCMTHDCGAFDQHGICQMCRVYPFSEPILFAPKRHRIDLVLGALAISCHPGVCHSALPSPAFFAMIWSDATPDRPQCAFRRQG